MWAVDTRLENKSLGRGGGWGDAQGRGKGWDCNGPISLTNSPLVYGQRWACQLLPPALHPRGKMFHVCQVQVLFLFSVEGSWERRLCFHRPFIHPQLFIEEQLCWTHASVRRGVHDAEGDSCKAQMCTAFIFGTAGDMPPLGRWDWGRGQPTSPKPFSVRNQNSTWWETRRANSNPLWVWPANKGSQDGAGPWTPWPSFFLSQEISRAFHQQAQTEVVLEDVGFLKKAE